MTVETYVPEEVSVIVNGVALSGYGPDTFVVVEREVPTFEKTVGADGEVARRKSANKSGTITITLMQTASDNATLSALLALDEESVTGTFPLLIKDNSGNTLCSAENGWVSTYPPVEFANDLGTREWVIEADSINMIIGGN